MEQPCSTGSDGSGIVRREDGACTKNDFQPCVPPRMGLHKAESRTGVTSTFICVFMLAQVETCTWAACTFGCVWMPAHIRQRTIAGAQGAQLRSACLAMHRRLIYLLCLTSLHAPCVCVCKCMCMCVFAHLCVEAVSMHCGSPEHAWPRWAALSPRNESPWVWMGLACLAQPRPPAWAPTPVVGKGKQRVCVHGLERLDP